MEIFYFKELASTQLYLKELLLSDKVIAPCAVVADIQTSGIGSRDNLWIGKDGNLFISFCYNIKSMPSDLKLESSSIYFAYILRETLSEFGSKIWLKWPNDFYIGNKKVGGVITTLLKDSIVCGIGLNILNSPNGFSKLDIDIDRETLLNHYFLNLEKFISWKLVFSKYKLEFYKNQTFFAHNNNLSIDLSRAILQDDGSVVCDSERVYSLR